MREGNGKENMERMREQKEGGQDFSENIPSREEVWGDEQALWIVGNNNKIKTWTCKVLGSLIHSDV